MKKVMFSILGCLLSIQCFAGSIQEIDGKLYISPGSVHVAPDAIYINIDGNFLPVEAIACDANGVYIPAHECRTILCLKCGEIHDSRGKCPPKKIK